MARRGFLAICSGNTALPTTTAWLVAVLFTWVVTTGVLALLIKATISRETAGELLTQSATSAVFACVVIGGPATAVALRVRRSRGLGYAALGGLATAAVILLFLWSYVAATGAPVSGGWQALLPLAVVTSAELSLALRLRGRREAEAGAGPIG
jgi:hypothetical protein